MSHYSSSLPWSSYETINTFPSHWDLNSSQSEQQIVNYYNSILEQQLARTNDPLARSGAKSNSSRGSISSGSHSPRLSKTSSTSTKPTAPSRSSTAESNASKEERRREQNRASQRAYRDRKDKQLKALEVQIKQWQIKHQGLCSSYTKQTSEVRKLKAQIEELTSKIIAVQTGLLAQSPLEFDMVPGYEYDCNNWNNLA
jgi:chromosome segregation ATPase